MEEKEYQAKEKKNTGLILFIPLAIIIVGIFILMHWESSSITDNESITADNNPGAPDFTLPGLDGKSVSLSDYNGKVVLLNIWATWCPPCVAEAPSLEKLYNIFKDDDFELLAVSIDADGEKVITPFMKRYKLTFPVLVDPQGSIMKLYGATGVPETFIVRKDGIIASKKEGAMDWASPGVVEYLQNLIQE